MNGPIAADWTCRHCRHQGSWMLIPRSTETPEQCAARHARQTRQGCVKGCDFHSTVAPVHVFVEEA